MMPKIIKVLIFSILLAFVVLFPRTIFAQTVKFYHLSLIYDKGGIRLTGIIVLPGAIAPPVKMGGYRMELVSFSNNILYKSKFDIPTAVFSTSDSPVDFTLNAPYFADGKQVNLYNASDKKILGIPVLQFAQTCGDNVCEPQENKLSCPQDCKPSPTPAKKLTMVDKPYDWGKFIIYLGGAGAIIIILVIIFKKIKNAKIEDEKNP